MTKQELKNMIEDQKTLVQSLQKATLIAPFVPTEVSALRDAIEGLKDLYEVAKLLPWPCLKYEDEHDSIRFRSSQREVFSRLTKDSELLVEFEEV